MQHWNDRRGTRNVISATAAADLQLSGNSCGAGKEMLEQAVGDRARVRYLSEAEPQQMLGLDGSTPAWCASPLISLTSQTGVNLCCSVRDPFSTRTPITSASQNVN